MNRLAVLLSLILFLTACGSSNPFEGGDGGDGDGGGEEPGTESGAIPIDIQGDMGTFTFNSATETLTVTGLTLEDGAVTADYRRRAGMDLGGYQAYTIQNDALDRHSTAFVLEAGNGGAVRGGIVVTGGQFNRYFGGAYYERDGGFSPPPLGSTTGLVSYAGTYVGLTNVQNAGGDLIPVPAGTDSSLIPGQASAITGNVFIDVDFADNSVNGAVYNRVFEPTGTALPTVVFIATDIASDGTFSGTVEYDTELTPIGTYSGIFGGANAEGVAGGVRLDEWDGPNDEIFDIEDEEEYGVFVLNQCGTPDEVTPICDAVNP